VKKRFLLQTGVAKALGGKDFDYTVVEDEEAGTHDGLKYGKLEALYERAAVGQTIDEASLKGLKRDFRKMIDTTKALRSEQGIEAALWTPYELEDYP